MRLSVRGLSVELGGRTIIDDAGFVAMGGDLIGLIGANGVGKSTLIRAVAGLLPTRAGTVEIDGRPVARAHARARAQAMAYLPQGQNVHWPLSVAHLVALGRIPHLQPFSRMAEGDRIAVDAAMARTQVDHLGERVVTTLSGGERARVLLARALAVEAPILLADEPVASLDPHHQLQVMELLRASARDGALVIAVLHDLALAARFCDRLLLMHDGGILADGPPAEVLAAPHLARAYAIEGLHGQHEAQGWVLPWRRLPPPPQEPSAHAETRPR